MQPGGPVVGKGGVGERGLPPFLDRVGFVVVVGKHHGAGEGFSGGALGVLLVGVVKGFLWRKGVRN